MSWRDDYNSRLCSMEEAVRIVESGDRFWTGLAVGQPSVELMDALADRKDELKDIEYIAALNLKHYKLLQPEYRDVFAMVVDFYSSLARPTFARGESAYLPDQSSNVGQFNYERHRIFPRRTGMITQISPPDNHGFVSLGLDNFHTRQIIDQGDWIIGEVNSNMPRTFGNTYYPVSRFDKLVENDEPLPIYTTPEATDVHKKMAEHVVSLLRDGDCLQVGIGAVPAMISKLIAKSDLKNLGIHTEMAPADTDALVGNGVVTGKRKNFDTGKMVMSFALGTQQMYDFLGDNPAVEFYATTYCNAIPVLAREKNLVAINGSIEIDIVGTICSESIGDTMYSGSGGQLDFVIGAYLSEGGRAINLLPSTAKNGAISRIVPYLAKGARVTVPRHYAQYIVTEYGVADLTGRDERERALALIEVAHPKFRDELLEAAKKRLML